MAKIIKLSDRYALCPECGKVNTLVEVVLFNGLNAVVHAGPCKSCLIRSGYITPDSQQSEIVSLDKYRMVRSAE